LLSAQTLVLASASPRRHKLLDRLGVKFSVCPAHSDGPIVSADPLERVAGHALHKAREVFSANSGKWVLAADTLVYGGQQFFGKPNGQQQARAMLHRLQELGEHRVYTGYCLLDVHGRAFEIVDSAAVVFTSIPEVELENYLYGNEWADKAGAYAIQGWAGEYARCVEGDLDTIVGMSEVAVKKLFAVSGFQFTGE